MDDFSSILNQVLDFLRQGFNDVNSQILGIIIALVAAFMLSAWRRLWALALGATVAHVVISKLLLPLIQGGGFHLPPLMDKAFWISVAALYVGYFIVIAVFFFLKRTLLRGGAATAH